jgi:hypothetical protein
VTPSERTVDVVNATVPSKMVPLAMSSLWPSSPRPWDRQIDDSVLAWRACSDCGHRDDTPDVAEAATVGPLEALQNMNLHEDTEPEQFRPWLLPESARWWDKLHGFWERGELLR